jgi:hypothetical protein
MSVKLIRMSSGEDVIATVLSETEENITIEDSIVAVPTSSGSIGFAPWSPLQSKNDKSLTVNMRFVVYIAEPDEGIVEQYSKMFSKLITPSSKLIT